MKLQVKVTVTVRSGGTNDEKVEKEQVDGFFSFLGRVSMATRWAEKERYSTNGCVSGTVGSETGTGHPCSDAPFTHNLSPTERPASGSSNAMGHQVKLPVPHLHYPSLLIGSRSREIVGCSSLVTRLDPFYLTRYLCSTLHSSLPRRSCCTCTSSGIQS